MTVTLIDDTGVAHELVAGGDWVVDAGELSAGETADVNLVFEVPADAVSGSVLRITSIWGNEIHVQIG